MVMTRCIANAGYKYPIPLDTLKMDLKKGRTLRDLVKHVFIDQNVVLLGDILTMLHLAPVLLDSAP